MKIWRPDPKRSVLGRRREPTVIGTWNWQFSALCPACCLCYLRYGAMKIGARKETVPICWFSQQHGRKIQGDSLCRPAEGNSWSVSGARSQWILSLWPWVLPGWRPRGSGAARYSLQTQDRREQRELIESTHRPTSWMIWEQMNLDTSRQFSCPSPVLPSRDLLGHRMPFTGPLCFLVHPSGAWHMFIFFSCSDLPGSLILLLS